MNGVDWPSPVTVGAGLAGSECAWQLARRGHPVRLYEMRPNVKTAAHQTGLCAELVCSNSFRSDNPRNAVGLLKREMELLDSLVIATGAGQLSRRGVGTAVFSGMIAASFIGTSSRETSYSMQKANRILPISALPD